MGMKKTLWRPSTCGCEIEYEWDRDEGPETRKHRIVSVNPCGQDHPVIVVGELLEGSEFHKDHVTKSRAKLQ